MVVASPKHQSLLISRHINMLEQPKHLSIDADVMLCAHQVKNRCRHIEIHLTRWAVFEMLNRVCVFCGGFRRCGKPPPPHVLRTISSTLFHKTQIRHAIDASIQKKSSSSRGQIETEIKQFVIFPFFTNALLHQYALWQSGPIVMTN